MISSLNLLRLEDSTDDGQFLFLVDDEFICTRDISEEQVVFDSVEKFAFTRDGLHLYGERWSYSLYLEVRGGADTDLYRSLPLRVEWSEGVDPTDYARFVEAC